MTVCPDGSNTEVPTAVEPSLQDEQCQLVSSLRMGTARFHPVLPQCWSALSCHFGLCALQMASQWRAGTARFCSPMSPRPRQPQVLSIVVKSMNLGARPLSQHLARVQISTLQLASYMIMGNPLTSLCASVYPSSVLDVVRSN